MTKVTPDQNYNTIVYYDDGDAVQIHGQKLDNLGLNNFQDWQCDAGFNRIIIMPDTSVYSAECENDAMGKLSDNSFQLFTHPTTCKRVRCTGNPDDIMVQKNAPNHGE